MMTIGNFKMPVTGCPPAPVPPKFEWFGPNPAAIKGAGIELSCLQ